MPTVAERDQLKAAIRYLCEGDVLVSTKLDRLARSMRHLLQIADEVEAKGAELRTLGIHLDSATPTGVLMLRVLGAVGIDDPIDGARPVSHTGAVTIQDIEAGRRWLAPKY